MPKNEGGGDRKSDAYKTTPAKQEGVISPPTLAEMGISYKQSSRAEQPTSWLTQPTCAMFCLQLQTNFLRMNSGTAEALTALAVPF